MENIQRIIIILFLIGLLLPSYVSAAPVAEVKKIRLGQTQKTERLVIETTKPITSDHFVLANPYRLVINLPEIKWPDKGPKILPGKLITGVRYGQFAPGRSRLVIDTSQTFKIVQEFIIPPSGRQQSYRLVFDLAPSNAETFKRQPRQPQTAAPISTPPIRTYQSVERPRNKKPVIVIDAGHGGIDPGASGRQIKEKDVVLKFAKELANELKSTGHFTVHLTRKRDVFLSLRERVSIARKRKADLFISVHADAIRRKKVRGMSIYTLSEKASDKEAAELARKENRSDIVAGIDFAEQPEEVTSILIDLVQRETKNFSVDFAGKVVKKVKGHTQTLSPPHRFAGFRVLKAPDVPSVLIELGFLTNSRDEAQLRSAKWRMTIAKRLTLAIKDFFREHRPLNK